MTDRATIEAVARAVDEMARRFSNMAKEMTRVSESAMFRSRAITWEAFARVLRAEAEKENDNAQRVIALSKPPPAGADGRGHTA